MPTGRIIDGKQYSQITTHSTKKLANDAKKRYKNKGWHSIRVIKEGPRQFTLYGKYRK